MTVESRRGPCFTTNSNSLSSATTTFLPQQRIAGEGHTSWTHTSNPYSHIFNIFDCSRIYHQWVIKNDYLENAEGQHHSYFYQSNWTCFNSLVNKDGKFSGKIRAKHHCPLSCVAQINFLLTDRFSVRGALCQGCVGQRNNKNHCCICLGKPFRLYPPLWSRFVDLMWASDLIQEKLGHTSYFQPT